MTERNKRLNYTGIHTAKIACLEAENETFRKEIAELKALVTKMIKK